MAAEEEHRAAQVKKTARNRMQIGRSKFEGLVRRPPAGGGDAEELQSI